MDYFVISNFEILCSIEIKQEYWLLDFDEINEVPNGYLGEDYEWKAPSYRIFHYEERVFIFE